MVVRPRRFKPLRWRAVVGVAKFYAFLQGLIFFAVSLLIGSVLAMPFALFAVLIVVWLIYQVLSFLFLGIAIPSGSSIFVFIAMLIVPGWIAFDFLDGKAPGARTNFRVSTLRFLLNTFNLGALHSWLLMNKRAARVLALREAAETTSDISAIARSIQAVVHAQAPP